MKTLIGNTIAKMDFPRKLKRGIYKMNKKVVVVLFGGKSSEHEISKISAATIISALDKEKYYVMPVYITEDGRWLMYDGPVENIANGKWEKYSTRVILSPDTEHRGLLRIVGSKFKIIPVDIVIPVLHGKCGEDGTIQGLLELAEIPYVGCGVLASSVSMDKAYTKIIADSIGIAQAKYTVVYRYMFEALSDEDEKQTSERIEKIYEKIEKEIPYPCFVKPANAGSSVGITKAGNREELVDAIALAAENDRTIVIEETICGREVECGVLGNNEVVASCVGEVLSAEEAAFYDFDAKYNNKNSKTVIPANISDEISEEIRDKAIKIFKALDGCGLSRVDFFIENETNRVIFNEINTFPGFTSISMYPMLFDACGIDLEELVDKLIELGLERYER